MQTLRGWAGPPRRPLLQPVVGLLPWELQPEWEARGWGRCRGLQRVETSRLCLEIVGWGLGLHPGLSVPITPSDLLLLWPPRVLDLSLPSLPWEHSLPRAPHPVLFILLRQKTPTLDESKTTAHSSSHLRVFSPIFFIVGKHAYHWPGWSFSSVQPSGHKNIHTVGQRSPPSVPAKLNF